MHVAAQQMLFPGCMWQKVCSRVFAVVLIGYLLALTGLVVHDYMTDPPAPWMPATSAGTASSSNTFVIITTTNGATIKLIKLSWKTSMMTSPKAKVNDDDIRHATSLDNYLLRSRKGND